MHRYINDECNVPSLDREQPFIRMIRPRTIEPKTMFDATVSVPLGR